MNPEHQRLIAAVTGAATRIYAELHSGFIEQVYREAMAVELRLLRLSYAVERNVEVFYRDEKVGIHRLDFVIANVLVVELKAAAQLSEQNISQTRAYLKTTKLRAALLINFPTPQQPAPEFHTLDLGNEPGSEKSAGRQKRRVEKRNRVGRLERTPPRREGKPLTDLDWDAASRRYVAPRKRLSRTVATPAPPVTSPAPEAEQAAKPDDIER